MELAGPEKKNYKEGQSVETSCYNDGWNNGLDAYRLWLVGRLPSVDDIAWIICPSIRGKVENQQDVWSGREAYEKATAIHSLMKERVL